MGKRRYRELPLEGKVRIVNPSLSGTSLRQVSALTGLSKTTIRQWVANEDTNPDKEYARA